MNSKRILSLVLAMVLAVSLCLPGTTAYAIEPEDDDLESEQVIPTEPALCSYTSNENDRHADNVTLSEAVGVLNENGGGTITVTRSGLASNGSSAILNLEVEQDITIVAEENRPVTVTLTEPMFMMDCQGNADGKLTLGQEGMTSGLLTFDGVQEALCFARSNWRNTKPFTRTRKVEINDGIVMKNFAFSVMGMQGFAGLDVTEWNAEVPTLYNIYYETATSCVKEKIGFRTVEIKQDVFLLNGRKIKLKGVNHHDTDAANGYTMSPDDIERDMLVCKRFNIDTVRTSHYPPDPLLLELADELGIYIVDENDLETHGTFAMQLPPTYNSISNDPKWESHYMDRIMRLYQRDKIRGNTSVIMWSLGNEAGGYHNTDAMYDYLKQHSPLPVHYESAIHCKRQAYDVGSEMYPSVKMVHNVGEKRRKQARLNDRPYFMCEYAHAMGLGPGSLLDYWKAFYGSKRLIGGCVWEWVDHSVWTKNEAGESYWAYGGDFGYNDS